MTYSRRIHSLLTAAERKIFQKLSTPPRIQDFLESLPANFEPRGETYMSPRRVLKVKTAHCLEGALLGAAVLAYHDQKPLLMDFQTGFDDEDHVVTLFKQNGYWGALSKTNHAVLRYRDAVYKTPRELAMSYFHEYFLWDGRKSLRAFSKPFDLSQFAPERWITTEEKLEWLVDKLDWSKHFPLVPEKNKRSLRPATDIEIKALKLTEWKR